MHLKKCTQKKTTMNIDVFKRDFLRNAIEHECRKNGNGISVHACIQQHSCATASKIKWIHRCIRYFMNSSVALQSDWIVHYIDRSKTCDTVGIVMAFFYWNGLIYRLCSNHSTVTTTAPKQRQDHDEKYGRTGMMHSASRIAIVSRTNIANETWIHTQTHTHTRRLNRENRIKWIWLQMESKQTLRIDKTER